MFNYRLLITVCLLIIAAAATGILRLDIDTDITRSLPAGETVISDALTIFSNHPIHDTIAVDITLDRDDPDTLVASGRLVEERFQSSGLFAEVGNDTITSLIPDLAFHVAESLPILFSREELEQEISPRLEKPFISQRIQELIKKLGSLEGIGQGRLISADPLGFMEPVMARMAMLAPLPNTRIHQGFLISPDNRHLLLTALPETAGTNTASAAQIAELVAAITAELTAKYSPEGIQVTLTPVGAYRAALDNERIIRHDVNLALLLSTAGIGLLLFIAFPRPLIGLFALLPALAGTALSLLIFSLFHPTISIMVLGFGGAIISITVDHGIAYLLFLDRPRITKGKEASREVRAIGILAVLTTCGAFLTLNFSGFPIFAQLGQFTAMGVLFSFFFVHFIFPRITPSMPPSTRQSIPLQRIVDTLYSSGKYGALLATLLACSLLFFARPDFNVSLESMNTVSSETLAADQLFTTVWGDMGNRVVLMLSGESAADIQQQNDHTLELISKDMATDTIESAFVPSMVFPGPQLAAANLSAWQEFWTSEKTAAFRNALQTSANELGFAEQAFSPFLALLSPSYSPQQTDLPTRFYPLLGITEKNGTLVQFINVTPGENYSSSAFYDRYGTSGKIFDSPYFSEQLATILFTSFATMLAIIAISITLLLFLFFASWQLTLITLLPPLFSYICTLGTMNLIGHPLDIPGLMLSIVILGMGIDYSIFFVRAHQRYRTPHNPSFTLIRMAVFMAGTSTLIGFGVLCFAQHSLLHSIGITSLLGIGYSLLGAFLLLPPLLDRYFSSNRQYSSRELSTATRVRSRYRLMEAYPRMFARFKLQSDPMFTDLPKLLEQYTLDVKTILDIGCGYGVPGCWCLEFFPNTEIIAVDPDPERIRVAGLAMGKRGNVLEDRAPEMPPLPRPPELILLLDMLHYLDDDSLASLFSNCFQSVADQGLLLIRYVTRADTTPSWSWKLEDFRAKLSGGQTHYRSITQMAEFMERSGFSIATNTVSRSNPELIWLIGRAEKR